MFYFRAGNIETRTPWNEPTMMAFKSWWGQLKKATNLDDYKVYLVGSFAEKVYGANIKTNDIDIILRGEIKSYPNLKDVLDKAMILGFQNKLLIDIKWQNQNLYQEQFSYKKKVSTNTEN